jgi:hypothetical protein
MNVISFGIRVVDFNSSNGRDGHFWRPAALCADIRDFRIRTLTTLRIEVQRPDAFLLVSISARCRSRRFGVCRPAVYAALGTRSRPPAGMT